MSEGINRRNFLKILGIGSAISAGTGMAMGSYLSAQDRFNMPEPITEDYIVSICKMCPGGCGIKVRSINGRAVKITGNPEHPVNRGRLCPKGEAGLQYLYHPDRIRTPLKRAGERGSGKWTEIGWKEATKLVIENLSELRAKNKAHTAVFVSGEGRGLRKEIPERFMQVYGSPNFIEFSETASNQSQAPLNLMQGRDLAFQYDIKNSRFLLTFGNGILESHQSPVQVFMAYGNFRRGREASRGKHIHIGPRLSITAGKADSWVATTPGTEGVLALGLAYLIIKEGLYDNNFINELTFGFDDWIDRNGARHLGYRNFVLKNFKLEEVSKLTGIPTEIIVKLAREFAYNKPSVAIGEDGIITGQDTYTRMAIHSLNALVGSINVPGGILVERKVPVKELPEIRRDNVNSKINNKHVLSLDSIDSLTDTMLSGSPYEVNTLFIYNSNPVFFLNNGNKFIMGMQKVPFIVSFSSIIDDTSHFSDLILPEHTFLEDWLDDQTSTIDGYSVFSLGRPAVKPLYNTNNFVDVILKIAKGIGSSVSASLPWDSYNSILSWISTGIYEAQSGDIFGPVYEKTLIQILEKAGWRASSYASFDEFWKILLSSGGWWDPVYYFRDYRRVFKTTSKKFEFVSMELKNQFNKEKKIYNDEDLLPNVCVNSKIEKGLTLYIHMPFTIKNTKQSELPFLQDIFGFYQSEKWESWIEINEDKAKEIGISNGDGVIVEIGSRKITLRAKLYNGLLPDVVSIPFGLGHQEGGRWSKNIGINPLFYELGSRDKLTGFTYFGPINVKVKKA